MWGSSFPSRGFSTKKGERRRKIKRYQQILQENPEDTRVRLKLGDLLLQKGEKERAVEEYLRAAQHYIKREMDLKAISVCQKVLRVDPTLLDVYHTLGQLYMKRGLLGEAKDQFRKILEMAPQEVRAEAMIRQIEEEQRRRVGNTPGRVN